MAKPPAGAPWGPVKYEPKDIGALQALYRGEADDRLQKYALKFIIEEICKTYDMSYRPESERDTVFAEGKRYVGLQIVKLLKINPQLLKRKDNG